MTQTTRIGEYNGIAAFGGPAYLVWCGNTFTGSAIRDQQACFDRFDADWQVVVTLYDPLHPSPKVALEPPAPNPSRGQFTASYSLPRGQQMDLGLFDLTGRRVGTLTRGWQPPGRHGISCNRDVLPAGVFWLRLSDEGEHLERRSSL